MLLYHQTSKHTTNLATHKASTLSQQASTPTPPNKPSDPTMGTVLGSTTLDSNAVGCVRFDWPRTDWCLNEVSDSKHEHVVWCRCMEGVTIASTRSAHVTSTVCATADVLRHDSTGLGTTNARMIAQQFDHVVEHCAKRLVSAWTLNDSILVKKGLPSAGFAKQSPDFWVGMQPFAGACCHPNCNKVGPTGSRRGDQTNRPSDGQAPARWRTGWRTGNALRLAVDGHAGIELSGENRTPHWVGAQ